MASFDMISSRRPSHATCIVCMLTWVLRSIKRGGGWGPAKPRRGMCSDVCVTWLHVVQFGVCVGVAVLQGLRPRLLASNSKKDVLAALILVPEIGMYGT
jgi:hypothetical protein